MHGSNIGRMSFLMPPVTRMDDSGTRHLQTTERRVSLLTAVSLPMSLNSAASPCLYHSVVEQLGGKQLVMTHLSHEDPNVRYEALLAVQKLMVHNWYVAFVDSSLLSRICATR